MCVCVLQENENAIDVAAAVAQAKLLSNEEICAGIHRHCCKETAEKILAGDGRSTQETDPVVCHLLNTNQWKKVHLGVLNDLKGLFADFEQEKEGSAGGGSNRQQQNENRNRKVQTAQRKPPQKNTFRAVSGEAKNAGKDSIFIASLNGVTKRLQPKIMEDEDGSSGSSSSKISEQHKSGNRMGQRQRRA